MLKKLRLTAVSTAKEKRSLRTDVVATGAGITREVREHMFDVYYSTKKSGSGLGLATSKRIIDEHGGRISVHFEPGKGTRVSLFVPVADR